MMIVVYTARTLAGLLPNVRCFFELDERQRKPFNSAVPAHTSIFLRLDRAVFAHYSGSGPANQREVDGATCKPVISQNNSAPKSCLANSRTQSSD